MMMVEMTDEERTRYSPHDANTGQALPCPPAKLPNGKARKIHIVEVGYCSDVSYLDKLEEKKRQHSALEAALKSYGYKVTVLTYILGFYGSTYISNQQTLKALGIVQAAADKLTRKVHEHSVICAHSISKSRRFLEGSFGAGRTIDAKDKGLTPCRSIFSGVLL